MTQLRQPDGAGPKSPLTPNGLRRPGKTREDLMPVDKRPRVIAARARQVAMKGGRR